jgi:hypothetical protein
MLRVTLREKLPRQQPEVITVQATENNWSGNRRNRFSIAPEVLLQAQKSARENQLEIIGIHHSHPDHAAIPSEIDLPISLVSIYLFNYLRSFRTSDRFTGLATGRRRTISSGKNIVVLWEIPNSLKGFSPLATLIPR